MQALSQAGPFELKGEWWRPDGKELLERFAQLPDTGVYGLEEGFARLQSERDRREGIDAGRTCRGPLRFDPESGLRLSLLGSSEIAFPTAESGFSVLGRLTNGVPCSLLGCLVTHHETNIPGGFADREVLAHTLICGAHVQSLTELLADHLVVTVPGLLEFLWAPAHGPDGKAHGGLGREAPEEHAVQLDDAEIVFSVGERQSNTAHASTRERVATVEVTIAQPLPFHEWLERWVEPLVRLAIFATRQPTNPTTLTAGVRVDSNGSSGSPPRGRRRMIHIVQTQRSWRRTPRFRWERMLVSHAALGSDFDSFVAKWWKVHEELAGAGDFLFGSLRDAMTLEPQLVTLVSVVEGYHRTFHDRLAVEQDEHEEITQVMLDRVEDDAKRCLYSRRLEHANELVQQDRLLAVVRRAGEVVEPLQKKAGRLAEAVVATRNYFVHLESKDARVLEGAALYDANQLVILALECNLLLDLGLSGDRALAGVQRAYSGERVWHDLLQRGCARPKRVP